MLSREKALDNLIYLEHGAHYAIGALGLLMLSGVVLLLLALGDSLRHQRRRAQAEASTVS